MSRRSFLACAVAVLALVACGDKNNNRQSAVPLPNKVCIPGITVVGDSNSPTFTYPLFGWPYFLEQDYENVVNASFPGTTTGNWVPGESLYDEQAFACTVMIQLGINDRWLDPFDQLAEIYGQNMRETVDDLLDRQGVEEVILIHTPKTYYQHPLPNELVAEYRDIDYEICEERPDGALCGLDFFVFDFSSCVLPDGIHLGQQCHYTMYSAVQSFLEGWD